MGKKKKRWPIWLISLTAAGWAVAGGVVIWLGILADRQVVRAEGAPTGSMQGLGLPTLVIGLGGACLVLFVITMIWLVYRIQQSRIPPWERGKKKRR